MTARTRNGCMLDVIAVTTVLLVVWLVLGLLLSARAPLPMPTPNLTLTYRATGLQQHTANVYVRTQRDGSLWPSPRPDSRPVLIGPLEGGGFAAGSGVPWGGLTLGGTDLASRLYARGCVIVCMGYTVDEPLLPGDGRYGTQYQAEDDIALVLADLSEHLDRIPDMDLRDVGLLGRSAGSSVALDFATKSNAAAWVVTYQTVPTFAAYQQTQVLRHFTDANGTPVDTLGQVPLATLHGQGALQRIARGELRCPVFVQGAGLQTYFGPLDWQSYVNVVSLAHPVEHVLAIQAALVGTPLGASSVYVTRPMSPRIEHAAYDWVCGIWGI